jgi:hypothetical protein
MLSNHDHWIVDLERDLCIEAYMSGDFLIRKIFFLHEQQTARGKEPREILIDGAQLVNTNIH